MAPWIPLLSLFAASPTPAQATTCSLLTAAEIEAVAGAKPGASNATDMAVPGSKQPMHNCFWSLPGKMGQVVISTATMPAGVTAQQFFKKDDAGTAALKAQNYAQEQKDFPDGHCSVLTPPASAKDGMNLSSCSVVKNGGILSVVFMSPSKKVSIDEIKGLVDKAAGRHH